MTLHKEITLTEGQLWSIMAKVIKSNMNEDIGAIIIELSDNDGNKRNHRIFDGSDNQITIEVK